ncbi:DHA1 family bicyclomycin/chloramphenicol resistance-like MFS transporter/DHA1 family florfenicol/chloramphenicol resistance protein-like MFS transporter [Kushneria sinocarnis]|uniref:Bcr/CflA family efflux transporter n=1 Tax=Kushneria sinocarnis TaxID=595502 RepID=A0A420WTZ1_9GAMM|nr:multidrug effflux MFS transporter [Kushneria sinocarnis]RKQ96906.1 DHA1 family bicyclomycin/chloramphenicol resistance-like MFS transporter/DHA1 family florfenicol/chloramphenicol resistance protein-like MFS transporter [Kushneria sinocarnis]
MSPQRTRILITLLIAFVMMTPIGVDIYLPSLPDMARSLGYSMAALQITVTLFLFTVGVGQVLIGPLSDRFGRRPVALGGLLAFVLGAGLGMMLENLALLYAARVLQGLGACSTTVVAFAAVRDRFTPERGAHLYSYLNGALCAIPALAPALGGVLATSLGWRSNFLFMVLFGLLVGVASLAGFPETLDTQQRSREPLYRRARYAPMLRSLRFWWCALIALAGMSMVFVYVTSAPVVLVERLGYSQLGFSAWFGGNALLNVLSFLTAPVVIRRYGRLATVQLGVAVMVVSGVMQLLADQWLAVSALAFMAPVAVLTIGFSLALGATVSLALEPFADRAGTAAALIGLFQLSGGAALSTLLVNSLLSPALAMAAVGLLLVAPLLLAAPRVAHRCGLGR